MNWEIFRDQIWNFIGVIIACVTLVITVILYFFQKNKKGLSYEILSKTSLLTNREKLEGKIKILYENQEVKNVKFLEIKILNTGNVGIPSSDYEKPLRFIFEEKAKILTSEIVKSEPKSLTTSLNIRQNEIILQPILMNSKDYIVIKVLVSNLINEEIIIDGRIKDVKDIKKQHESKTNLIFAFIGAILFTVGMIQTIKMETLTPSCTIHKTISFISFAIGYIIIMNHIGFIRIFKKIYLIMSKNATISKVDSSK